MNKCKTNELLQVLGAIGNDEFYQMSYFYNFYHEDKQLSFLKENSKISEVMDYYDKDEITPKTAFPIILDELYNIADEG